MPTLTKDKYLTKDDFINILKGNGEPLATPEIQQKAQQAIARHEIPHTKMEDWRKTSLKRLLEHSFVYGQKIELDRHVVERFNISGMYSNLLVFVNGYFVPSLSRILDNSDIVAFSNMAQARNLFPDKFNEYFNRTQAHEVNFFSAINTRYASDGGFIWIKDNARVKNPVHIYFFSDGQNRKIISQTRNLIIAGAGSKASVLLSYHPLSTDYMYHNSVTEIFVEHDAYLDFNIFQGEGYDSFHTNLVNVEIEQGGQFYSHTLTLCGIIMRNDLRVTFNGPDAYAELNGLTIPDHDQVHDNTIFVHHKSGGSISRQLYRNLVDDNARAVFYGKVLIDKGAKKSEAYQLNNNILLTTTAKVHSKPHLIIYNDDVAASHGSTTGQIDKEAMFYMQSRGISKKRAQTLLLQAFANEILNKIQIEIYKLYVKALIRRRLQEERVEMLCAKLGPCRFESEFE
jgi:Fe-S cluster assembly protein SufD